MPNRKASLDAEDYRPEKVIVDEKDLVWDDELGYHRCPLGLIQTPREIVECRERSREGDLKLYLRQLEREGICDVVVVHEDEEEVWVRAVTCCYDHIRAKHPGIVIEFQKWYGVPPLNGRALIDAETGLEVFVHRIDDAIGASEQGSCPEREASGDLDLDIPF